MAALTTTTVAMVPPSEKKTHQFKPGKREKLTFLATVFFKESSFRDIAILDNTTGSQRLNKV